MQKLFTLACFLLLATSSSSEARHWRWHWHGHHFGSAPYAYRFAPAEDNLRRRWSRRESANPADIVPPNWQLQPPDPNWKGKRFLSPDGTSWLAVYSFPTATEPITRHMQSVAFAEGETLTYLGGERDRIAVSGTKGDKIFYRKAIIACDGKVWHHIAFEYPFERRRVMDPFVIRAATIVDQAENDGCEQATSSVNPDR
jgi:serine/threonine-protein kinase